MLVMSKHIQAKEFFSNLIIHFYRQGNFYDMYFKVFDTFPHRRRISSAHSATLKITFFHVFSENVFQTISNNI